MNNPYYNIYYYFLPCDRDLYTIVVEEPVFGEEVEKYKIHSTKLQEELEKLKNKYQPCNMCERIY